MPVLIDKEAFINISRSYVHRLLEGICEYEILLAVDPQPQTVRIVAKLKPVDFQAIKFSDLYLSAQKLVAHLGRRHLDPVRSEHHADGSKSYDPYFDTLEFQVPE